MSWNNTTAQDNNTGGYALEGLFTDHCFLCHVALFFVLLGSLILGLPISWNILWHLKVSVQSSSSHQCLPKCILLWETENWTMKCACNLCKECMISSIQQVPVSNFNLTHLKIEPLRGISTIESLSNQLSLCEGCLGPGKFWTNKRKEPLSMELLSGIFCTTEIGSDKLSQELCGCHSIRGLS